MSQNTPRRPPCCVIIPTLNDLSYLADVLGAVLQQLGPGDRLIVVDAGSIDGSQSFLAKVAESTPGFSAIAVPAAGGLPAAVKSALEFAPHGAVLLQDARVPLPAGFLDEVAAVLAESPGTGAIAVPVPGGSPCLFADRSLLSAAPPAALLGDDLEPLRQVLAQAGRSLLVAPPAALPSPLPPRPLPAAQFTPATSAAAPPPIAPPAGGPKAQAKGRRSRGPRPGVDRPLRVAILTLDSPDHACYQLRLGRPLEALGNRVEHRRAIVIEGGQVAFHPKVMEAADLVVVQRFFPRLGSEHIIAAALEQGTPVIYETDDLLHDVPVTNPHHAELTALTPFVLGMVRRASAITVSTGPLGDALRGHNPRVHVLPNMIDERIWKKPPTRPAQAGPVVIGYAGTATHLADLALIEEALLRISQKWGAGVVFRFLGCVTERLQQLPGLSFIRFEPGYAAYAGALPNAGIDVGIVPLEDNAFNRAKSHIKWLEYSAAGIAGVYSDLDPYGMVEQGETGLRVANTADAWFEAIDRLVADEALRRRIAEQARADVLANHGMRAGSKRMLDAYLEVVEDRQSATA